MEKIPLQEKIKDRPKDFDSRLALELIALKQKILTILTDNIDLEDLKIQNNAIKLESGEFIDAVMILKKEKQYLKLKKDRRENQRRNIKRINKLPPEITKDRRTAPDRRANKELNEFSTPWGNYYLPDFEEQIVMEHPSVEVTPWGDHYALLILKDDKVLEKEATAKDLTNDLREQAIKLVEKNSLFPHVELIIQHIREEME